MTVAPILDKLAATLKGSKVQYQLQLNDQKIDLNPLLGQTITLEFNHKIYCMHCSKLTKRSFANGYCYPCSIKLAYCDICMMQPEKCSYYQGHCRQPEWGEQFCLTGHYIYLSNTSQIKVGITRATNIPTRWIDQGAEQAITIIKVSERLLAGKLEVALKEWVADKTNWRNMLKSEFAPIDLRQHWQQLQQKIALHIDNIQLNYGVDSVQTIDNPTVQTIVYPVLQYPQKIVTLNPEKTPKICGTLMGIKGQYLYFDSGVINIRKYRGYQVHFLTT